jgi:anti-sigma-K factor RskA
VDVKAYIESGILEQYVLGELSLSEAQEVENVAKKHSEVAAEIESISIAFESYALEHEKEVSSDVRQNIMDELDFEESTETRSEKSSGLRVLSIAASILLLVSVGVNIYQQNQLEEKDQKLEQLYADQEVLAEEKGRIKTSLEKTQERLETFQNPNIKQVLIKGSELSPESYAFVHWNQETKKAQLSTVNLPAASAKLQYQLWAIVDGTPVDLGVFDLDQDIIEVSKEIENPSAFAVTLEEKGGKPQPNLEQLYLIGNV